MVYTAAAHVEAVQAREERGARIALHAEPVENSVPVQDGDADRHQRPAAPLAAPFGADILGELEEVEAAPRVHSQTQGLHGGWAVVRRVVVTRGGGDGHHGFDVAFGRRTGDDRHPIALILVRGVVRGVVGGILDDDALVVSVTIGVGIVSLGDLDASGRGPGRTARTRRKLR